MKVPCPACEHVLSAPKSAVGTRVACGHCEHTFFWTDEHHAGETFVVYDLETTGLDPRLDEFIQVAAMRFTAGSPRPDDTFASFAKPRRPISSFIEQYTGASTTRPTTLAGRRSESFSFSSENLLRTPPSQVNGGRPWTVVAIASAASSEEVILSSRFFFDCASPRWRKEYALRSSD